MINNCIAGGQGHTVGLKSDGTCVATGRNHYYQCNVSGWTDIVEVAAGAYHTLGLKSDGTVVAVGRTSEGQITGVGSWTDIISISCAWQNSFGLKSDGTVVQAGTSVLDTSSWTDIVQVCGVQFSVYGLKSDGTVVAVAGSSAITTWTNIIQIGGAYGFIFGIKADGTIVSSNSSNSSTWGAWTDIIHATGTTINSVALKRDGTTVGFGSAPIPSGLSDIIQVACGQTWTYGLKSNGTVVTVGGNNIYGELNVSSWVLSTEVEKESSSGGDTDFIFTDDIEYLEPPPPDSVNFNFDPENETLVCSLQATLPVLDAVFDGTTEQPLFGRVVIDLPIATCEIEGTAWRTSIGAIFGDIDFAIPLLDVVMHTQGADLDITLPLQTVEMSTPVPPITGDIDISLPVIETEFLQIAPITASISTSVPVLTSNIVGNNYYIGLGFTLPVVNFTGHTGINASIVLPALTMTGISSVAKSGNISISLPAFEVEMFTSGSGIDFQLPVIDFESDADTHIFSSIDISLRAFTVQMTTPGKGIIATLPVINFDASGDTPIFSVIETELPSIRMTSYASVGITANIDITISVIDVQLFSGAALSLTLPSVDCDFEAETPLAGSLSFELPKKTVDFSASQATVTDLSFDLPVFMAEIISSDSRYNTIDISLPVIHSQMTAINNGLSDLTFDLPRMKVLLEATWHREGGNILSFELPCLVMVSFFTDPVDKGILRHVREEVR